MDIKRTGKTIKIDLDPRDKADREIIGDLYRKLKGQGRDGKCVDLLRAAGMEEPPEIDPGG